MVLSNLDPSFALAKDITELRARLTKLETRDPYYYADVTVNGLTCGVPGGGANLYLSNQGDINAQTAYLNLYLKVGAQIACPGTYSWIVTNSPRNVSVDSSGVYGYVPSSRQFKQDIEPAAVTVDQVLALQLVLFRYIKEVEEKGDLAEIEWGLIAEDVDALGLDWLVDYDGEGKPFGLKYDRLALALLPVVQDQEARLKNIEQRLSAAGL
jgi:hypothetical protein